MKSVKSKPAILSNWKPVLTSEFLIEESYQYGGVGGRVSKRTSHVNLGYDAYFDQSFEWDDLGVLKSVSYPQLTGGGSLRRTGPKRTVSYRYTNGFLTAVPGYAASISYYPNGMMYRMERSTGALLHQWPTYSTQLADSSGMARPRRIYTSGTDQDWSSGTYAYDGGGNITKIGSDWYLYEGRMRIRTEGKTTRRFGETDGLVTSGGETLANIFVDVIAVMNRHPDRTGVTTLGHELLHRFGQVAGFPYCRVQEDDLPSPEKGLAASFGALLLADSPDIDEDYARLLLDIWLEYGETAGGYFMKDLPRSEE